MVDDPYKVLGVSQGATQEEIKRAYHRKAKECHPDLHPDDPDAGRKMNDVNEAYDMLMNPDKYANRRAQSSAGQSYGQPYGQPYGSPYGQQGQQGYGRQTQQGQPYGNTQGAGGWYGDFGTFDFGDMFGFGNAYSGGNVPPPQEEPGDSPQVRQAVQFIRARQYQAAVHLLEQVVSTGRNARWYYLSGVANHGAGNLILATEHMQRAVQLDPNNQLYHALLNQYRQAGQTYEQNSQGFNMGAMDPQRLCMSLCAAQFLCMFCRCC